MTATATAKAATTATAKAATTATAKAATTKAATTVATKAATTVAATTVAATTVAATTVAPVGQTTSAADARRNNVANKVTHGIGITLHTDGRPIKGLTAEPVKVRPTRKMLRTIAAMHGHPGRGNCVKRYHLYKVGMTLLHCKVTEGLVPSDVNFYAELGYLTLRDCTDAEYAAAVAAWEDKAVKAT